MTRPFAFHTSGGCYEPKLKKSFMGVMFSVYFLLPVGEIAPNSQRAGTGTE
jgi:hypothetical protein